MYTPKNPHIPEPPTKKLKLLSALSFAAVAAFALIIIILSLVLITQIRTTNDKQNEVNTLSDTLTKSTDALTKARRELIAQSMLPAYDSFPQQCPNGNEADGLFTPLSSTPVEGYNVFLVDCRSNIGAGKSNPRILVFRVNNDGSKDLTYGANDTEPLCITNKVPVANKIALKLKLSVCQTN